MNVLLDENMPHQLRADLGAHEVSTAQYLGWSGVKNGELLKLAEAAGFEVLTTGDQSLTYQQNLTGRSIAVVTLTRLKWSSIQPHLEAIRLAIDQAQSGSFQVVNCNR